MIAIGRLVKLIAADVGEDHGWAAEHAIFQSDTFKNRDIVVRNISDDNSPSTAKGITVDGSSTDNGRGATLSDSALLGAGMLFYQLIL